MRNAKNDIEQLTPLHQLTFGALSPQRQAAVTTLGQQLGGVNFTLKVSPDIVSEMWEKYLFLSTLGAVTVLARSDTQSILSTCCGADYIENLFAEVLSIVTAAGYTHRPKVVNQLLATLLDKQTPLVSSLYRDIMAGNVSERHPIIGSLVERATIYQCDAPVLRACLVQLQLAIP